MWYLNTYLRDISEKGNDMKASVNKETCIGCGMCESICPAVFAMNESVAEVIADPVPSQDESACRDAMESCPVEAITISE